jgi:type II restriction enzyme
MANLDIYNRILKINEVGELLGEFCRTLVDTNTSYDYFVEWDKIKRNVSRINAEICLLNSLIGSKDVEGELSSLLARYPETIVVFPLIIAVRKLTNSCIKVIEEGSVQSYEFKRKTKFSPSEISRIVNFSKKSGILALFSDFRIKDLRDYLLGVEVGMDTHARKNRSGKAMELALKPFLDNLKSRIPGIEVISQKNFEYISDKYGVPIPEALTDRKFDFVIKKKDSFVNIEVNYYSGSGSKPQEIVDSYINRQNELKNAGWGFIWVTDGIGWPSQLNQIRVAFQHIDFLLNLNFASRGMLYEIVANI